MLHYYTNNNNIKLITINIIPPLVFNLCPINFIILFTRDTCIIEAYMQACGVIIIIIIDRRRFSFFLVQTQPVDVCAPRIFIIVYIMIIIITNAHLFFPRGDLFKGRLNTSRI